MSTQDGSRSGEEKKPSPEVHRQPPASREAQPTAPAARKSPDGATDGHDEDRAWSQPRTPVTQQIGRAVVVLLAVLFGIFAVANSQPVSFSWIFGETQVITDAQGTTVSGGVPLILLMVGSLVIGLLVGITIMWQRGRARRRNTRTSGED